MKVLFNADDFGLTKGVTDGIIKAHQEGIVTSTTLMMNGLATEYAVRKAKENPNLKVGIHLVLSWGKPICIDVPHLLNETGEFKYNSRYTEMDPPNIEEVEKEWTAQIEKFLALGLPLHHIDSHHHIHGWEPLKDLVVHLAKKYNVPVRYADSLKDHEELLLTEALWLDFYGEKISEDLFEQMKHLKAKSVEVMTHPALVDEDLKKISSYVDLREKELDILCKLEIPEGVEII